MISRLKYGMMLITVRGSTVRLCVEPKRPPIDPLQSFARLSQQFEPPFQVTDATQALVGELAGPQIDVERLKQAIREVLAEQDYHPLPTNAPLRVDADTLCKMLGISRRTITRWVARRRIPFEKIGRVVLFDVEAVDAALKKYRRNAAGD